ncbi:MAG TPA: RNA-binding protein, partial [Cyanobacteria bacterium UBA11162]|nr:RNA-binding protein [Cyanobacteria bacterium UBA11162]
TPIAFLKTQNSFESLQNNSYVQREIASDQERWYTNAATFADLDGDGHNDLIIGNYFADGAEILNTNATGVESMQHSMTRAYNGGKNRVLRWTEATIGNNPTVQFKEVAGVLDETIARGWTLGVGAADLDGDLLPELYFANDFGPDRLLHNRSQPGKLQFALLEGEKKLTTPNSKVLGHDSFKGMGVDFGDINSDGLLDIYVSNIAADYALEESHFMFTSTGDTDRMKKGIAPYVDRSEPLGLSRSGWGWETKFGDFDNDGKLEALQATGFAKGEVNRWPELHELAMGNDQLLSNPNSWFSFKPGDDLSGHNHNPFFVRAANGRYYDLAKELGVDAPQITRGIATADVDGDGDLDFAIANQWEPSYFYRNDSQKAGKFLELRLLRATNVAADVAA